MTESWIIIFAYLYQVGVSYSHMWVEPPIAESEFLENKYKSSDRVQVR